ncbi:MAG: glycosyltransferase family 4 protein [Gemmatimonadales bacterium]|nr:glycosyltransferase family 4 protein [Gemmatimonadales bacterium]
MTAGRRPLRIGMLLESDGPGGAEVVVFRLTQELRQRGHHVVPFGPLRGVGWLGKLFDEAGVARRTLDIRRALDPAAVWSLVKQCRAERLDVLHSHEFAMAIYATAAARLHSLPHVITMHGNQQMTAAWRRRVALRWAFRRSRATVAVSSATKAQLDADLGLPEGMVRVIRNGVPKPNGNAEAVRREVGVAPGEIVLLMVGNMDHRKGHMVLLNALALLEDRGRRFPWRLLVAGGRGGDQEAPVAEFVAARGWGGRVNVLLQRSDVPDLLAAADIFLMPSLWEGLPLAVLEAMLAGRPVLASRTSGIPEAIESGVDGVLVPPGDAAALADALAPLLADPARRALLGDAARRRAEREFTIEVMTDHYEQIYAGR